MLTWKKLSAWEKPSRLEVHGKDVTNGVRKGTTKEWTVADAVPEGKSNDGTYVLRKYLCRTQAGTYMVNRSVGMSS